MEEENIPNPYVSGIQSQKDESKVSRRSVNAEGSEIERDQHSNISSQNSQSNAQMSRL